MRRRRWRRIVRGPVVGPTAWIDAAFEGLSVPRGAHRHDPQPGAARKGTRRDIDVVETARRRPAGQEFADHVDGDLGGPVEIGVLVVFERYGDARDPEKRPLDGGRHGAGVEHVDAGIQSAIDAADDDVGPPRAELRDPEFHGIGGAAVDGPATAAASLEDLLGRQRREERDGVADPALFGRWRHDAHFADPAERALQCRQPRGKDSIVVGEQREHGENLTL